MNGLIAAMPCHSVFDITDCFPDLDFLELLPEGLLLEPETFSALCTTMKRDCRVLESFKIMDYSLLVGIHNLDLAGKERAESSGDTQVDNSSVNRVIVQTPNYLTAILVCFFQAIFRKYFVCFFHIRLNALQAGADAEGGKAAKKDKLVAHSTAMESIQVD